MHRSLSDGALSGKATPSQFATPLINSSRVAPPKLGCSEVSTLLFCVMAFAFSVTGVVWPLFWKVFVSIFAVTFLIAFLGIISGKHHSGTLRPLIFISYGLSALFMLSGALTYADYQSKCVRHQNLSHRSLQNAYMFQCGWNVVFLWFWSIGLVCSALCFGLVGFLGNKTITRFDQFHKMRGGHGIKPGTLPRVTANVISGILIAVCLTVLLFESFKGHERGKVDGVCPSPTSEYLFKEPERNDLGCCEWTFEHGTCCQQSACNHKQKSWPDLKQDDDGKCDTLIGLLSCAACHPTAGVYAHSLNNVTVCESFCNELFESCCSHNCHSAYDYCTTTLELMVDPTDTNCFNDAAGVGPNILVFVIVFALSSDWVRGLLF